MEEKFKRSKRRFDGLNAIKRRVKKWLSFGISHDENNKMTSNAEKMECVLSGRGYNFLRTTGNPCNCWMCSGEYKFRNHRAEENRKAQKDINEQSSLKNDIYVK